MEGVSGRKGATYPHEGACYCRSTIETVQKDSLSQALKLLYAKSAYMNANRGVFVLESDCFN